MAKTTPSDPIVFFAGEDGGRVLFRTEDNDHFIVSFAEAVRACSAVGKEKEFKHQLDDLLDTLKSWIGDRVEQVSAAYLQPRTHDILFLVVQKMVGFNQQLSEDLVDLELNIANNVNFNMILLDAMCIPKVSEHNLQAFLASSRDNA